MDWEFQREVTTRRNIVELNLRRNNTHSERTARSRRLQQAVQRKQQQPPPELEPAVLQRLRIVVVAAVEQQLELHDKLPTRPSRPADCYPVARNIVAVLLLLPDAVDQT